MKKILKSTLILILTLCLGLVFVGCNQDNDELNETIETLQTQISSLQTQMTALQTEVDNLPSDSGNSTADLQNQIANLQIAIINLQTQIDSLQSADTSGLQSQITALQSNVTSLQSQINDLKNTGSSNTEKIYNIGDTIPCVVNGIHMFDIELSHSVEILKLSGNGISYYYLKHLFYVSPSSTNNKLLLSTDLDFAFDYDSTSKAYTSSAISSKFYTFPTTSEISNSLNYIYIGFANNNVVGNNYPFIPFAKVKLSTPTIIDNTNN